MATKFFSSLFLIYLSIGISNGWRAVPANEAMFARQSADAGLDDNNPEHEYLLPRTSLHSIYKFGFCEHESTNRKFLRTTLNLTLDTKKDSMADYIYVLADMSTQRFYLQCVVMKIYTAKKFQFWKSRLPIYYCQGQLLIMMMNSVQRLAVHEFYILKKLNMAANIYFEFYQPNIL